MATRNLKTKVVKNIPRISSLSLVDLPHFLCPALAQAQLSSTFTKRPTQASVPRSQLPSQRSRYLLTETCSEPSLSDKLHASEVANLPTLPTQCAGCGALSQTSEPDEPGFFTLSRRTVQTYLNGGCSRRAESLVVDEKAIEAAAAHVDPAVLESLKGAPPKEQSVPPPLCDRCHNLMHHHSGTSIQHPSMSSIRDTIEESPHKYNHVYHVIDAADFPMSFIPGLHRVLHLSQRSQNRRSKTGKYHHGRQTEVSFIITRSDLLAPAKEQVDSLMPYFVEVLRDALGSFGQHVRLGNVRCVSAKRSWWTKELKEDIFRRGGGGWMVGKVNVGKSQLFESVFPKGRIPDSPLPKRVKEGEDEDEVVSQPLSLNSLLPPAPEEVAYPPMPLVHHLPGTTASPIRVPFGGGKGELVDLPGLSRGDLEHWVREEHRSSLVMRARVLPEQQTLKPGQSLLIGGFIRITPTTPDVIMLAYAFTPISPHLTSTEKAIAIQNQERETGVANIGIPESADKIASAGKFQLKWDVTKQRSGPLVRKDAVRLTVEQLPFRVLSTDILIEGCGWIELVCQVRKRQLEESARMKETEPVPFDQEPNEPEPDWPEVEVFSPEGKFIAQRRPMGAWLMNLKSTPAKAKGRPRKSMKGAKKAEKAKRRMSEGRSSEGSTF